MKKYVINLQRISLAISIISLVVSIVCGIIVERNYRRIIEIRKQSTISRDMLVTSDAEAFQLWEALERYPRANTYRFSKEVIEKLQEDAQ